MEDTDETLTPIAAAIREAIEVGDPAPLAPLLAPEVRWGTSGERACRGPAPVLATFRRGAAAGGWARLESLECRAGAVLVALTICWPRFEDGALEERFVVQRYDVVDGAITEIRGFEDLATARSAALSAPSAPS